MNCKPGDLAVIVFCPRGAEHLLGRMVRLTVRAPDCPPVPWRPEVDARPSWYYEGKRLALRSGTVVEKLNDCGLSPIRDPGEFARDQTLAWAPVPLPVVDPSMLEGK